MYKNVKDKIKYLTNLKFWKSALFLIWFSNEFLNFFNYWVLTQIFRVKKNIIKSDINCKTLINFKILDKFSTFFFECTFNIQWVCINYIPSHNIYKAPYRLLLQVSVSNHLDSTLCIMQFASKHDIYIGTRCILFDTMLIVKLVPCNA